MRRSVKACALFLLLATPVLAADSLPGAKAQLKTGAKTDVQVQHAGADGLTLQSIFGNNTAQGGANTGGAQVLPAVVQSSLPTYSTNGNLVGLTVDASGRLYTTINGTSAFNLTQVNGSAFALTNPLFTQLSDGAAAYVGAKTGQLPSALGQATMAGSLSVAIASNQGTLAVSQGAPTGAAFNRATPVSIASAGTTAIVCKGSLTISQPLKVYRVIASGAALARCTIQYNDNATLTKFGDVVLSPSSPNAVFDCAAGFCGLTTSSTATTQQIELSCNNFDSAAQDFGCSVQYCQAASGC